MIDNGLTNLSVEIIVAWKQQSIKLVQHCNFNNQSAKIKPTFNLVGGGAAHNNNWVQITPDSISLISISTTSGPYLLTKSLHSSAYSPGMTPQTLSSAWMIAAFNIKYQLIAKSHENQTARFQTSVRFP